MRQNKKALLFVLMITLIFSFRVNKSFSQVTDFDGNKYKTIKIDIQEWMAENLNVEHYRNGDIIPQVQDSAAWVNLKTGAWCYYENNSVNGITYGKLYNWYAVNDQRGLAPKGWHIPSDTEWTKLTDYLGGVTKVINLSNGLKLWVIKEVGGKLKDTILWASPNTGATNEIGFTALPGGERGIYGYFDFKSEYGIFWTSSEVNDKDAWYRVLDCEFSDVFRDNDYKEIGFSVRCVRD